MRGEERERKTLKKKWITPQFHDVACFIFVDTVSCYTIIKDHQQTNRQMSRRTTYRVSSPQTGTLTLIKMNHRQILHRRG